MEKVEKGEYFSKIYHPIIDDRILAGMSRQEIKVYLVLNRFIYYKTGIAFPSVKKIAELAGISKNDVRTAADRLEAMGLILTEKEREGLHVRKYYGLVRGSWINTELALYVISSKPKRTRQSIARTKDGRFRAIPENTEYSVPQNTKEVIPQNTDERVPQNGGTVTVNTERKENNIKENNINRNKDIEKQSVFSGITPAITSPAPANKARELAAEHGFRRAMEIIWGSSEEPQSSEDFDKSEKERIEKAKEYFERNDKRNRGEIP